MSQKANAFFSYALRCARSERAKRVINGLHHIGTSVGNSARANEQMKMLFMQNGYNPMDVDIAHTFVSPIPLLPSAKRTGRTGNPFVSSRQRHAHKPFFSMPNKKNQLSLLKKQVQIQKQMVQKQRRHFDLQQSAFGGFDLVSLPKRKKVFNKRVLWWLD